MNLTPNKSAYGDCGYHTFYAEGSDGTRCCAEMTCPYYINKHRSPVK